VFAAAGGARRGAFGALDRGARRWRRGDRSVV